MHLGLIADGNRRWAEKNNRSISEGHRAGFLVIKDEIYPTLRASGLVDRFTVYAFSTENWKRSPLEVKSLMDLYMEVIDVWFPVFMKDHIRVFHAGRKDRLPKNLLEKIEWVESSTKQNTAFTIHICLDYGSRDEIERAAKQGDIMKNLDIPDLDIILRTGGDHRLSNFCLWQAAYAELFFTDKLLPELRTTDIIQLIEKFQGRERRLGR